MSAKLKLFLIVLVSVFATAATGVYISQRQPSTVDSPDGNEPPHQLTAQTQAQEIVENPERANYKPIPLESLNYALQGTDPADLALNAINDIESTSEPRKVEVVYNTQKDHALVTITQTKQVKNSVSKIKYRVEMTTFGRWVLASSPRMWQIVWAGSQVENVPESNLKQKDNPNL
jgi:hypothetical protein